MSKAKPVLIGSDVLMMKRYQTVIFVNRSTTDLKPHADLFQLRSQLCQHVDLHTGKRRDALPVMSDNEASICKHDAVTPKS